MKDLCIIHAGMPKTGSTSLQTTLFSGISDTRISYANLPDPNHSSAIYSLFTENPERYHANVQGQRSEKQIEEFNALNKKRLIAGFLDNSSSIEIISGEDIYHLTENALVSFYGLLKNYFKRVVVVAYIRPPKSHMESAFQQLVKYHGAMSLNFQSIYHPYLNFLRFHNVFGRGNVYLWKFDPQRFPRGDISLDFCQRLGIDIDSTKVVRENESISMEAVSLLFACNCYGDKSRFGKNEYVINNKLVEVVSVIGRSPFRFSDKFINEGLKNKSDDLNWIESRLNESLRESNSINEVSIGSEEELLQFSVRTVPLLRELIGTEFLPCDVASETPQYVAKLVDALKCKISGMI